VRFPQVEMPESLSEFRGQLVMVRVMVKLWYVTTSIVILILVVYQPFTSIYH